MNHSKLRLVLALSSLSLVAACADQPSQTADSVEGIYKVDTLTHNDAACSPGGDSALGSDTFAFVTTGTVFGQSYVQVTACASVDDCRAKVAELAAGSAFFTDFIYTVDDNEVNGVFTGRGADTGYDAGNGVCTMGDVTTTTLTVTGTTLQVDQQITLAADYPAVNGDGCSTDAAQKAAAGLSCSQYESMTAELVDTL